MDELEEAIDEIPELSKPISIVNLVKYSASVLQRKTRILRFTHFAGAVFILSHAKNAKKFKGQREKLCGFHRTIVESQHLCVMKAVIKLPN
jgi:hypothetical protein